MKIYTILIRKFTILTILISFNVFYSCGIIGMNTISGNVEHQEKIHKLYIYIGAAGSNLDSYSDGFGKYLHNMFLEQGVENIVYIDNSKKQLSLSDKTPQEELVEYKPTHILELHLKTERNDPEYLFLLYDVKIINESGDTIWSGNIDMMVGAGGSNQTEGASRKLIEKLKNDKII
ncbi:hypothetical protein ETU09_09120 [Apibacter muscae]|uniref:DUF4136 domain-containing protein n=1 Tax=Apibacter muscae TaxID=2509004 RepID=A0A563DAA2_9FLAO|nr:hypothetical protein [Apibacter muscae]TWP26714.1 hypothetical protein ETU09_09120 [Apibacter muscae]